MFRLARGVIQLAVLLGLVGGVAGISLTQPDGESFDASSVAATGQWLLDSGSAVLGVLAAPESVAQAKTDRPRRSDRRNRDCPTSHLDAESLADGRFAVRRGAVSRHFDNVNTLRQLARVEGHVDVQGRVDGVRVTGFNCRSVLWHAGLRRGDLVHSVSGREIRSVVDVLDSHDALKKRDEVVLRVTRDGELMTLRLTLVDG